MNISTATSKINDDLEKTFILHDKFGNIEKNKNQ